MLFIPAVLLMNWDALGAIGELIGAVAVVLTLFYLAYQVRQARSEMRQSFMMAQEIADREMGLESIRNDVLRSASLKFSTKDGYLPTVLALKEYAELTDAEASALNNFIVLRFRMYADQIRNLNLLTAAQVEELNRKISFFFSRPSGRVWLEALTSRRSDDEVVRYIQEQVSHRGDDA